ncbi:unnamed protein product [Amoebophrya sp. A25]|nr:unnamed protein product [Amoebophrya sp. A25]|eukprot:GSA25T00011246001.1
MKQLPFSASTALGSSREMPQVSDYTAGEVSEDVYPSPARKGALHHGVRVGKCETEDTPPDFTPLENSGDSPHLGSAALRQRDGYLMNTSKDSSASFAELLTWSGDRDRPSSGQGRRGGGQDFESGVFPLQPSQLMVSDHDLPQRPGVELGNVGFLRLPQDVHRPASSGSVRAGLQRANMQGDQQLTDSNSASTQSFEVKRHFFFNTWWSMLLVPLTFLAILVLWLPIKYLIVAFVLEFFFGCVIRSLLIAFHFLVIRPLKLYHYRKRGRATLVKIAPCTTRTRAAVLQKHFRLRPIYLTDDSCEIPPPEGAKISSSGVLDIRHTRSRQPSPIDAHPPTPRRSPRGVLARRAGEEPDDTRQFLSSNPEAILSVEEKASLLASSRSSRSRYQESETLLPPSSGLHLPTPATGSLLGGMEMTSHNRDIFTVEDEDDNDIALRKRVYRYRTAVVQYFMQTANGHRSVYYLENPADCKLKKYDSGTSVRHDVPRSRLSTTKRNSTSRSSTTGISSTTASTGGASCMPPPPGSCICVRCVLQELDRSRPGWMGLRLRVLLAKLRSAFWYGRWDRFARLAPSPARDIDEGDALEMELHRFPASPCRGSPSTNQARNQNRDTSAPASASVGDLSQPALSSLDKEAPSYSLLQQKFHQILGTTGTSISSGNNSAFSSSSSTAPTSGGEEQEAGISSSCLREYSEEPDELSQGGILSCEEQEIEDEGLIPVRRDFPVSAFRSAGRRRLSSKKKRNSRRELHKEQASFSSATFSSSSLAGKDGSGSLARTKRHYLDGYDMPGSFAHDYLMTMLHVFLAMVHVDPLSRGSLSICRLFTDASFFSVLPFRSELFMVGFFYQNSSVYADRLEAEQARQKLQEAQTQQQQSLGRPLASSKSSPSSSKPISSNSITALETTSLVGKAQRSHVFHDATIHSSSSKTTLASSSASSLGSLLHASDAFGGPGSAASSRDGAGVAGRTKLRTKQCDKESYLRHYWMFPRRQAPESLQKQFDSGGEAAVQNYVDTHLDDAEELGRMLIADPENTKVLVHLHGGGMFFCDADSAMTVFMAWLCRSCNVPCLLANFRRPPTVDVATTVSDATHLVTEYLHHQCGIPMENISIIGDSAGGQLALQVVLRLLRAREKGSRPQLSAISMLSSQHHEQTEGRDFYAPEERLQWQVASCERVLDRLIVLSPWCDQGADESNTPSFNSNRHCDMIHPETIKYIGSCVAAACNRQPNDPVLSAFYAPEFDRPRTWGATGSNNEDEGAFEFFDAMPPLLIQSGETEALRDVHVNLAERLSAAGAADVTLQVFQDAAHIGHLLYAFHPVALRALYEIKAFLQDA